MLRIGDIAPEFEITLGDGTAFRLSEALEKGPLVLYFYPKDFTAGCTREAQGFRDVYSDIRDLGASVVGVSTDDPDSHRRFREARRLPFQLATDAPDVPASLTIVNSAPEVIPRKPLEYWMAGKRLFFAHVLVMQCLHIDFAGHRMAVFYIANFYSLYFFN